MRLTLWGNIFLQNTGPPERLELVDTVALQGRKSRIGDSQFCAEINRNTGGQKNNALATVSCKCDEQGTVATTTTRFLIKESHLRLADEGRHCDDPRRATIGAVRRVASATATV